MRHWKVSKKGESTSIGSLHLAPGSHFRATYTRSLLAEMSASRYTQWMSSESMPLEKQKESSFCTELW